MFHNESYSHDLNSSFTHVHDLNSLFIHVHADIGTLAYFSLHPGDDAAALAHLTPYLTIHHVAFGQRPSIHTIPYLILVIEIGQSFMFFVKV